jgi:hypothetical protein
MGGAGHHDRRLHSADGTAGSRPTPPRRPVAISLEPTTPAHPTGLRSPSVRPLEPGPSAAVPGAAAVRGIAPCGPDATVAAGRQLGRPPSRQWATSGLMQCSKEVIETNTVTAYRAAFPSDAFVGALDAVIKETLFHPKNWNYLFLAKVVGGGVEYPPACTQRSRPSRMRLPMRVPSS